MFEIVVYKSIIALLLIYNLRYIHKFLILTADYMRNGNVYVYTFAYILQYILRFFYKYIIL